MYKAIVNRKDKSIIVKAILPAKELLDVVTIDEVMAYYNNKLYMILDRIGKKKVMAYFNLADAGKKNG